MNKVVTILVLVAGLSILATAYYFFGVKIIVKNEAGGGHSFSVSCSSGSGKGWVFAKLEPTKSQSKYLLLSSGERMECSFQVEGLPIYKSLVIGYFKENIKHIEIVLTGENEDLLITILDGSFGMRTELEKITLVH